jgi:hypothetical protein
MANQYGAPQPHKWNAIADEIPDAEVPRVVQACKAGIKLAADRAREEGVTAGQADYEGWQKLHEVHPRLASAAEMSAGMRGKPRTFSLAGIITYLQSETSENKRAAAARRRVHAGNPAPTAESSAGKGGGK